MKVTALLSDELIEDVKKFSNGKNTTEALVIALTDWIQIQKIKALNKELQKKPLKFQPKFSGMNVRQLNRVL